MSIVVLVCIYKGGTSNVHAAAVSKSLNYMCVADTSVAGKIDINMKVTPTLTVPDTVEKDG